MTDDVEGLRYTPEANAAIEALQTLGFDYAEADMIYHGDMLGAKLGKKLADRLAALQRERDEAERVRSLMAKDWLDFCESMGVQFDTQEAVASDLQTARRNVDDLLTAAVSDYNDVLAHLQAIIAADDDFRASMAPDTEKDPVTLACDRARSALNRFAIGGGR